MEPNHDFIDDLPVRNGGNGTPSPAYEKVSDWPDPEDIGQRLPKVEPFKLELLPEAFRALVEDTSERMNVPMDYPAAIAVLSLAGAVNRRAIIQPKARDTSWKVTPNLWGALIAPPGQMKTPTIAAITAPLSLIQKEWHEQFTLEMEDYRKEKERFDTILQAWKEDLKAHAKGKKEDPGPRPSPEPLKPINRRVIVQDATVEALHALLGENPAGVLLTLDEIAGWIASFDKPGWEAARAFMLECWTGDQTKTLDRVGRGTVVASICISVLGAFQPDKLRQYLSDAVRGGASNDGLMQRFQVAVWPDLVSRRSVDRAPDLKASARVEHAFRKLLAIDPERDPLLFRFDPDAQPIFDQWSDRLDNKLSNDNEHPALIAHLSKYRSLMPSLALLFELADRSSASPDFTVSAAHATQAGNFCEYLESHARRIYSCVVNPALNSGRHLAERIKAGKLQSGFSARAVYRNHWAGLDTTQAVKDAIGVLVDANWLVPVVKQSGFEGGRTSYSYLINPKVESL